MINTTLTFEDFKTLVVEEKKTKLLSQDEVRHMFSPAISRVSLYRWIESGMLQFFEVDGKKFFRYDDVLNACRVGNKMNKRIQQQTSAA